MPTLPEEPEPLAGRMVGDYLICGRLGAGGFGKVLLALQQPIGMQTALKVLELGERSDVERAHLLEKFEGEARALATLNHPNIVRLLKYGVMGATPYLVMEYVPGGRTLATELTGRRAEKRAFNLGETVHVLRQLLDGLAAAHDRGIIHRDIKPENVMLQEVQGNPALVRLVDFGLAKLVEGGETGDTKAVGTLSYMAPEQLVKAPIGPWTDLYALSWLLVVMLTGRRPYQGLNRAQVVAAKVANGADPIEAGQLERLPEPLQAFLRRGLAFDSASRFGDVAGFRRGLAETIDALKAAREAPSGAQDLGPMLAAPPAGETPERGEAAARRDERVAQKTGPAPVETTPEPRREGDSGGPAWYDPAVSHLPTAAPPARVQRAGQNGAGVWPWIVLAALAAGGVGVWAMSRDHPEAARAVDTDEASAGETTPVVEEGRAGVLWTRVATAGAFGFKTVEGQRRVVGMADYWLAKTETTVAQYRQCVEDGACTAPTRTYEDTTFGRYNNWGAPGRSRHPINGVTWAQAGAFCKFVGGRLPTEAEWEWAAQSGTAQRVYPWGTEAPSCERVVMADARRGDGCGTQTTAEVCSRPEGRSREGICDLLGNVKEWTADWVSANGARVSSERPAPADASAIARGPHFVTGAADLEGDAWKASLKRAQGTRMYVLGFRCAR